MNKYVNEMNLTAKKTFSSLKLTIEIIGALFWGLIALAGVATGIENLVDFFCLMLCCIFTFFNALGIYSTVHKKSLLSMAYFYARYFEGDLDGYIYISNLTKVVGKDEYRIYNDLRKLLKKKVMKGFILRDYNGKKQIVLDSKIKRYKCRHCGATIEKRVDFAGACPYCKGSDIYAELKENN